MTKLALTKTECDEHWFGSSFDPVLNGVAQGLAALFPPIENARPPAPERMAGPSHDGEDEGADE